MAAMWRVDFWMNDDIALYCDIDCDLIKYLDCLEIKPFYWEIGYNKSMAKRFIYF